jgi:hypothetical protein
VSRKIKLKKRNPYKSNLDHLNELLRLKSNNKSSIIGKLRQQIQTLWHVFVSHVPEMIFHFFFFSFLFNFLRSSITTYEDNMHIELHALYISIFLSSPTCPNKLEVCLKKNWCIRPRRPRLYIVICIWWSQIIHEYTLYFDLQYKFKATLQLAPDLTLAGWNICSLYCLKCWSNTNYRFLTVLLFGPSRLILPGGQKILVGQFTLWGKTEFWHETIWATLHSLGDWPMIYATHDILFWVNVTCAELSFGSYFLLYKS